MRSLGRSFILVTLLAILLPPAIAFAAGPFYASTDGATNGDGSATFPRKAANATELTAACTYFANLPDTQLGAGEKATVYWIVAAGGQNIYFTYELSADGTCQATGTAKTGLPPGFGVPWSPVLIIGGLITLGLALVIAAWLLSRRLRTRPGPA